MGPVNNLRNAMSQAGRFGHVEAVQGDDHVSYQVRKGFGNWLVHVVKWYSNNGYKERIIEQRTVVLDSLAKLCDSNNQSVTKLRGHLRHGLRFQAQSINILGTVIIPKVVTKDYALSEKLIGSKFRTADAALKNLIIPGSNDDPRSHEGVNKEKFGAAYWEYAHANTLGSDLEGVTDDSKRLRVNGRAALLEYALSKDENEKYQDTELYQIQHLTRDGNNGIDFEAWGIPDDINEITLRRIDKIYSSDTANKVLFLGLDGPEALAKDRKIQKKNLDAVSEEDGRNPLKRALGLHIQLSELCEQFMRDEGIGEDSVPLEQ